MTQCDGASALLDRMCRAVVRIAEHNDDVMVGVGCRRGKHRSVTIVEEACLLLAGGSTSSGRTLNVRIRHVDAYQW